MKKSIAVVLAVSALIISCTVSIYLLVIAPQIAQNKLDFEREKHLITSKEQAKQACLDRRAEAVAEASKQTVPNASLYAATNEEC